MTFPSWQITPGQTLVSPVGGKRLYPEPSKPAIRAGHCGRGFLGLDPDRSVCWFFRRFVDSLLYVLFRFSRCHLRIRHARVFWVIELLGNRATRELFRTQSSRRLRLGRRGTSSDPPPSLGARLCGDCCCRPASLSRELPSRAPSRSGRISTMQLYRHPEVNRRLSILVDYGHVTHVNRGCYKIAELGEKYLAGEVKKAQLETS